MNPEAINSKGIEAAPSVDGRHPFDQGVAIEHWTSVIADIDARTPHLPELNIQIAETETLPTEGVVLFDAAVDAPKAEEKSAEGRIARAKEAFAMLGETLKLPELKPLAVPALAVAVAACNAGGGAAPQSTQKETASPAPIVSTAPTAEASKTPYPATGNTYPEVTPSPTAEVTPTPEPTPTPKPLGMDTIVNGIVDGKKGVHPAVKFSVVQEEANKAFENNPEAGTFFQYHAQALHDCHVMDPNVAGARLDQENACEVFVTMNYKAYIKTGDVAFYNLAKDAYNSFISKYGLGKSFKATIDDYLKHVGLIN